MDAIDALIGVIADALGISTPELTAQLKKDAENFKTGSEMKSHIAPLFATKFAELVPKTKVEQARGKALKDARLELETKIFEKTQIKGRFDDGLIDTLAERIKAAPAAAAPADVNFKDSQEYKDLVSSHRKEVKQLKLDQQDKLRAVEQSRVEDKLIDASLDYLKDTKNSFILPESESIVTSQVKKLAREVMTYQHNGEPVKISINDNRDFEVLDKDGLPITDEKHSPISVFSIVNKVATTSYFPVKQASGRNTPATGEGDAGGAAPAGGKVVVKTGEKSSIEVNAFKSEAEFQNFMQGEAMAKYTPQERHAIREEFAGAFDDSKT